MGSGLAASQSRLATATRVASTNIAATAVSLTLCTLALSRPIPFTRGGLQLEAREKQLACGELGMTERELSDCRIAFSTLDQTGSGRLQIDSIRKVMVLLRRKISSDRLRQLFGRMDEDGSGYIEFMEFLRLMKAIDLEI